MNRSSALYLVCVGAASALVQCGTGGNASVVSDGGRHDTGATRAQDGGVSSSRDSGRDVVSVVCPSDWADATVPPTGSCVGVGSCAYEAPNSCGPGVTAVSSTPDVFSCDCSGESWSCTLIGGGLGIVPCPEAGAGDE